MAVKEELLRRHIASDNICGSCSLQLESINHVLFSYNTTLEIWENNEHKQLIADAPSSSFLARFTWLASKVSTCELRSIMTQAWVAWFCRNKLIYEQESVNLAVTIAGFLKLVSDYQTYAKRVFGVKYMPKILSVVDWVAPPARMVKINVNAHVRGNIYTGLGVVIRDDKGKILVAAVRRVEAGWDPEVADAAAFKFGLQIAKRFCYTNVWVEGDALQVMKNIQDKSRGFTPLYHLYDDIIKLADECNYFGISHVKRGGNTVAHLVARMDTKGSTEFVCMSPIPQSIITLADLDLL